jgi:hypothetical protein
LEHDEYTEQRDGLLQSIERDRQDVRVAMHELSDAAQVKLDLLDVATHIRSAPLAWTVAAFLVGAWLGDRGRTADIERRNLR